MAEDRFKGADYVACFLTNEVCVGYSVTEESMVLTEFGVPLTHFGSFPISSGDSFTREPFLNSDAPLKVSIDAWGTAVVPTGAFEVLRVRTSVIYSAFRGSAAFGSAAAPVIGGCR